MGEKITLVIDPHTQTVLRVETAFGDNLGQAHPIVRIKNARRRRQQPHHEESNTTKPGISMVEMVHQDYADRCALPGKTNKKGN